MNYFFCLLIFATTGAESQAALKVDAQMETIAADALPQVGQVLRLVITAEHTPGGIALLPTDIDFGADISERRAVRQHERRHDSDKETDQYTLEIIPFQSGPHVIRPIPVVFGEHQVSTPTISFTAHSTLNDDEQLVATSTRPEALAELEKMTAHSPPPMPIQIADHRIWWLLAALLGLVMGFCLFRWARRYKSQKLRPVETTPAIPPFERALAALATLRMQEPNTPAELKAFFVELSHILREWVGAQYGFESLDLTTDELKHALAVRTTVALDQTSFVDLLLRADQIKFAKSPVEHEECRQAVEQAHHLVKTVAHAAKPIVLEQPT